MSLSGEQFQQVKDEPGFEVNSTIENVKNIVFIFAVSFDKMLRHKDDEIRRMVGCALNTLSLVLCCNNIQILPRNQICINS